LRFEPIFFGEILCQDSLAEYDHTIPDKGDCLSYPFVFRNKKKAGYPFWCPLSGNFE